MYPHTPKEIKTASAKRIQDAWEPQVCHGRDMGDHVLHEGHVWLLDWIRESDKPKDPWLTLRRRGKHREWPKETDTLSTIEVRKSQCRWLPLPWQAEKMLETRNIDMLDVMYLGEGNGIELSMYWRTSSGKCRDVTVQALTTLAAMMKMWLEVEGTK